MKLDEQRHQSAITRRTVLLIAWPIILSNISTPLLGLVDTAVIGNLGDAALIGAIAIGGTIFSFLYWGFGFLRMGTTGLVAQAHGAGDELEVKLALYRASGLALVIGLLLVLLQGPLGSLAFYLLQGSAAVESAGQTYFTIRIYGAPLSLIHLVVIGYLLGQQRTGAILWLQLLLNGTNIFLDIVFVVYLDWGVAGVAAATVIAELLAATVGIILISNDLKGRFQVSLNDLIHLPAIRTMLEVNRDIMIRTLCLIFAFAWFTNEGAKAGDVLLATNAILMQFVSFSAFFLDGYALAGESLVGAAIGGKQQVRYERTIRFVTELGLATALLTSLLFILIGPIVIDALTNVMDVRDTANSYLIWAVLAPPISLWCYLLDGIFIGATATREMRNAMIISLLIYLVSWYLLSPVLGNHGLWLSLHVYFIARAVSLAWYLPNIKARFVD